MIFLEGLARPLLLLHAVGAAVLVGASTHHLLACRAWLRGRAARVELERRYARVAAIAYLVTYGIGLLEYPAYKVRVRAEYFDAPSAMAAEVALRREAATAAQSPPQPEGERPRDLTWVGRLFDIKEHWAALAVVAAVGLLVLSRWCHPSVEPGATAIYVGLSAFLCSAAWLSALVGIVTASYRSVGGAG